MGTCACWRRKKCSSGWSSPKAEEVAVTPRVVAENVEGQRVSKEVVAPSVEKPILNKKWCEDSSNRRS
jgi:hypothetical protein